jgi:hypothetical protein
VVVVVVMVVVVIVGVRVGRFGFDSGGDDGGSGDDVGATFD